MNYYDWLTDTTKQFNSAPAELRRGQFFMIQLHKARPDLYDQVSYDRELDCFYDDKKIDAFLLFLCNNWERPNESK